MITRTLSRRELHELRIAEIAADLDAGCCTADETVERMVDSTIVLYWRWLTPCCRLVLKNLLLEECLGHPGFLPALEREV